MEIQSTAEAYKLLPPIIREEIFKRYCSRPLTEETQPRFESACDKILHFDTNHTQSTQQEARTTRRHFGSAQKNRRTQKRGVDKSKKTERI